ncbi:unnamed protein product [Gongylonema pulchrum]|uniref:MARVEL domain-containing protein n=1 Tax=Gongylonema pulchrum TaxID=637853 RepID=A0A183CUY9_9BILA|nr:unnamed protein product [Gongylonema pulchrum]
MNWFSLCFIFNRIGSALCMNGLISAWQKAILFFIIFSQFLAFISLCTGICITCFRPATFVFAISLFLALLCSLIADGVFFLAANRVDNRFVQGMVGTYEQRIGYAFYVHLLGTLCWLLAFLFALLTTYKFFTKRYSEGVHCPQAIQKFQIQLPRRIEYPRTGL